MWQSQRFDCTASDRYSFFIEFFIHKSTKNVQMISPTSIILDTICDMFPFITLLFFIASQSPLRSSNTFQFSLFLSFLWWHILTFPHSCSTWVPYDSLSHTFLLIIPYFDACTFSNRSRSAKRWERCYCNVPCYENSKETAHWSASTSPFWAALRWLHTFTICFY